MSWKRFTSMINIRLHFGKEFDQVSVTILKHDLFSKLVIGKMPVILAVLKRTCFRSFSNATSGKIHSSSSLKILKNPAILVRS